MPYGGIKMAEQACTTYGYQPSEKLHEIFTKYCRTHNQAVFANTAWLWVRQYLVKISCSFSLGW